MSRCSVTCPHTLSTCTRSSKDHSECAHSLCIVTVAPLNRIAGKYGCPSCIQRAFNAIHEEWVNMHATRVQTIAVSHFECTQMHRLLKCFILHKWKGLKCIRSFLSSNKMVCSAYMWCSKSLPLWISHKTTNVVRLNAWLICNQNFADDKTTRAWRYSGRRRVCCVRVFTYATKWITIFAKKNNKFGTLYLHNCRERKNRNGDRDRERLRDCDEQHNLLKSNLSLSFNQFYIY